VLEKAEVVEETATAFDQAVHVAKNAISTFSTAAVNTAADASLPVQEFVNAVSSTPLSLFGSSEVWGAETGGDSTTVPEIVLGATTVVSTALSLGYVIWLVRGGAIFASLVASLPAWTLIDPLPILTSFDETRESKKEDDERLVDLVR
jgi:hypothetical protein